MTPASNLPVAVLGATSRMAMDFVTIAAREGWKFSLFSRRATAVDTFLQALSLPRAWNAGSFAEFAGTRNHRYRAVLNFVGVGDPARAKEMGSAIFDASREIDALALQYAEVHTDVPYIFLSSGAAYGRSFDEPVSENSMSKLPINALDPKMFYSVAKVYAEALHRAADRSWIIDIRIFNYISRRIDLNSRFFIAELINSIKTNVTFITTKDNMWRDFLHPEDFFRLIDSCINVANPINAPIDAYSLSPIDKSSIINAMIERYGLRVEYMPTVDNIIDATGKKNVYYSNNRRAAEIGYHPTRSSLSGLLEECDHII